MDHDTKVNLVATVYYELGCDLDDLLDNGRKTLEKLQGRHEAIREMSRDMSAVIPEVTDDDLEEVRSLKLKIANYFKNQEGTARDRASFQKCFCRASEAMVALLKDKHDTEMLKLGNKNLGTHPSDRPALVKVRGDAEGDDESDAEKEADGTEE